ncbi:hypothetical protein ACF3NT_03520 [Naumannella halotolerans]|uniref:hypothetical protein n=1 Tax=Naumannella halotolerans TaxID=993414 RepID=UPI00370D2308
MFWILLFAAITVIGIVVTVMLLLRLYRKFRALLGSVDRFGATVAEGLDALARIDTAAVLDPDNHPGSGFEVVHSDTVRADWSR